MRLKGKVYLIYYCSICRLHIKEWISCAALNSSLLIDIDIVLVAVIMISVMIVRILTTLPIIECCISLLVIVRFLRFLRR